MCTSIRNTGSTLSKAHPSPMANVHSAFRLLMTQHWDALHIESVSIMLYMELFIDCKLPFFLRNEGFSKSARFKTKNWQRKNKLVCHIWCITEGRKLAQGEYYNYPSCACASSVNKGEYPLFWSQNYYACPRSCLIPAIILCETPWCTTFGSVGD